MVTVSPHKIITRHLSQSTALEGYGSEPNLPANFTYQVHSFQGWKKVLIEQSAQLSKTQILKWFNISLNVAFLSCT